jgi:cupin 2 domain-containing protein
MQHGNLFSAIPASLLEERFDTLLETSHVKVERIVSEGHATPTGEWWQQDRDEWVLLLSGSAGIRLEGESGTRSLRPGDYILIPARLRHRVEWTASHVKTVWLALHYDPARRGDVPAAP